MTKTAMYPLSRIQTAAPQCQAFNSGRWKAAENWIRNYSVEDCTKGLHCVTFVSFNLHLLFSHWTRQASKAIHPPLRFSEDNPIIAIFNSMWTADIIIIVIQRVLLWLEAAIVQDLASLLTVGVHVKLLQRIVRADDTYVAIGGPNINLLPQDPVSANNHVDLIFHQTGRLGNNGNNVVTNN